MTQLAFFGGSCIHFNLFSSKQCPTGRLFSECNLREWCMNLIQAKWILEVLDDLKMKMFKHLKRCAALRRVGLPIYLISILFNCWEATLSFVGISISKEYLFWKIIRFSAVDLDVGSLRELGSRVSCYWMVFTCILCISKIPVIFCFVGIDGRVTET